MVTLADAVLPPPVAPWLVEIGGTAVFVVVGFVLALRWRPERRPGTAALLFVGALSMLCRAQAEPKTVPAQLGQVGAWVVGMNLMYAVTLTVPLLLVRALCLPASTVIP